MADWGAILTALMSGGKGWQEGRIARRKYENVIAQQRFEDEMKAADLARLQSIAAENIRLMGAQRGLLGAQVGRTAAETGLVGAQTAWQEQATEQAGLAFETPEQRTARLVREGHERLGVRETFYPQRIGLEPEVAPDGMMVEAVEGVPGFLQRILQSEGLAPRGVETFPFKQVPPAMAGGGPALGIPRDERLRAEGFLPSEPPLTSEVLDITPPAPSLEDLLEVPVEEMPAPIAEAEPFGGRRVQYAWDPVSGDPIVTPEYPGERAIEEEKLRLEQLRVVTETVQKTGDWVTRSIKAVAEREEFTTQIEGLQATLAELEQEVVGANREEYKNLILDQVRGKAQELFMDMLRNTEIQARLNSKDPAVRQEAWRALMEIGQTVIYQSATPEYMAHKERVAQIEAQPSVVQYLTDPAAIAVDRERLEVRRMELGVKIQGMGPGTGDTATEKKNAKEIWRLMDARAKIYNEGGLQTMSLVEFGRRIATMGSAGSARDAINAMYRSFKAAEGWYTGDAAPFALGGRQPQVTAP